MTIRLKLLTAWLLLTVVAVIAGLAQWSVQQRRSVLAFRTADEALWSVNQLSSVSERVAATRAGLPQAAPEMLLNDLDAVAARAGSDSARHDALQLRQLVAATIVANDQGDPVNAKVATDLKRLAETISADALLRLSNLEQSRQAQGWLTPIAISFFSAIALALALALDGWISHPIHAATGFAHRIAMGRFDHERPPTGACVVDDLSRALFRLQDALIGMKARLSWLREGDVPANVIPERYVHLETAIDHMGQGICLFGPDGRLAMTNRRFGELFLPPRLGATEPQVMRQAGLEALAEAAPPRLEHDRLRGSYAADLPDGRTIAVAERAVPGGGWVATFEDVSERRVAEARLVHIARHDLLTGLPNRVQLHEHLELALARARRGGSVAVLCLNLDRFKTVNDTLGHTAGDALLCAVAQRLRACIRETDLVVRLGGDEFAVVQEGASQPTEASALARRLIEAIMAPLDVNGQPVMVGTSIGVAISGEGHSTSEALLKCADLALYRSKASGGNGFHFFEEEMDAQVQARRALELDLRKALADGQFEIFYQPLVRAGRVISGFEALLRWHHPERGMVSPAVFIPLAEEIGLIVALGNWVLRHACAEAATWPESLKVAVNLSPKQFRGRLLIDEVSDALASSGLPANRLEVEVTESILLQDDELVLETLHAMRAMGVRVAMDDFGTGYSSLIYLRRFPLDKIKIDQSFIRGMTERDDCLVIVRAVIGLARSLGMAVNAEGVETHEQMVALEAEGCAELQGYIFSRPRPASFIPELLREYGSLRADSGLVHSEAA